MRRFLVRLLFLVLLLGAVGEAWHVFGPSREGPFWSRHPLGSANDEGSPLSRWLRSFSSVRVWTDRSGRTLEGIPIAGDAQTVRVRALDTQTVYDIPLERLSDSDREFVLKWRKSFAGSDPLAPSPPHRWPAAYNGNVAVEPRPTPVGTTGASQVWQTPRYELRSYGPLDPAVARSLASICESIDGACRAVPLPMLWGRARSDRRVISIYPSETTYQAAGGPPSSAGCFIPFTGEVLICEPALRETDLLGQARGFSLSKRQRYQLLVHELVHQASLGITMARFPAWVPEGLAEFFAATQKAPGQFQFRDSHIAVRNRLTSDGVEELKQYPVWSLDRFLDRDLFEWNRITAKDGQHGQGWIQYMQALLLVEFFSRADSPEGRGFRSYLEAVLTGAEGREAAAIHLLRGRSHAELEQAMSAYWGSRGVNLKFVGTPSVAGAGTRFGVGLGDALR